jgi:hypothetical protein
MSMGRSRLGTSRRPPAVKRVRMYWLPHRPFWVPSPSCSRPGWDSSGDMQADHSGRGPPSGRSLVAFGLPPTGSPRPCDSVGGPAGYLLFRCRRPGRAPVEQPAGRLGAGAQPGALFRSADPLRDHELLPGPCRRWRGAGACRIRGEPSTATLWGRLCGGSGSAPRSWLAGIDGLLLS